MKFTVAALLLLATVVGAIGFGRAASRGRTVADWAVGGRSMGTLLFWFMNAGEIYTTFAVFGIAGYAWALGAPAYLAFCSVSLSFAIGYLLMPKIWRAGRSARAADAGGLLRLSLRRAVAGRAHRPDRHRQPGHLCADPAGQPEPDRLADASTRRCRPTLSLIVAGVLMVAFVLAAGLRSAAFAAGVKDVMMIVLMVVLAATVARKVGARSMFDIFDMAEAMRPGIGKLPGAEPGRADHQQLADDGGAERGAGQLDVPAPVPDLLRGRQPRPRSAATRSGSRSTRCPTSSSSCSAWPPWSRAPLPPGNDMNAALLQFVSTRYPDWVVGLLAGTGVPAGPGARRGAAADGRHDLHAQRGDAALSGPERIRAAADLARRAGRVRRAGRLAVDRTRRVPWSRSC